MAGKGDYNMNYARRPQQGIQIKIGSIVHFGVVENILFSVL
jgi:hypothetical protein